MTKLSTGPSIEFERLVQHGPFVADNRQNITRLYEEFRAGRLPKMSELTTGNK